MCCGEKNMISTVELIRFILPLSAASPLTCRTLQRFLFCCERAERRISCCVLHMWMRKKVQIQLGGHQVRKPLNNFPDLGEIYSLQGLFVQLKGCCLLHLQGLGSFWLATVDIFGPFGLFCVWFERCLSHNMLYILCLHDKVVIFDYNLYMCKN